MNAGSLRTCAGLTPGARRAGTDSLCVRDVPLAPGLQRCDQRMARSVAGFAVKCRKFLFTVPFQDARLNAPPCCGNIVFVLRKTATVRTLQTPIPIVSPWPPILPIALMIRSFIALQPACAKDSVGSRDCHFMCLVNVVDKSLPGHCVTMNRAVLDHVLIVRDPTAGGPALGAAWNMRSESIPRCYGEFIACSLNLGNAS